ncbi:MAG: PLP-dependent transferase [Verrucomicrobiales bacterium]|nr:PLP-dependent transferase [Verrucomicrobiales bacterium]
MRDPFSEPFSREEDLGKALPESEHAVSVCLPRWSHVIGYEEGDPEVLETFECGYPRFVPHPFVDELFFAAQEEFAKKNEVTLVFPSLAAAWRCAEYVKRRSGAGCRLESYGWEGLTVLLVDEEYYGAAWKYWQHSGEIVSSREAESALKDEPVDDAVTEAGKEALETIRERIASFYSGVEASDVYLFSSGMGAVSAVHRILAGKQDSPPTIQIEFPYLDSFKLQEQFGGGVVDLSVSESGGVNETQEWLASGNAASAVFTELPSNPLLRTADLAKIYPLLREHEIPLVVDDTVATSVNVDSFRFADVVTTSLTKTFSGAGDVAAGAVIIKKGSVGYEVLKEALPIEESSSPLFSRDAIVLERNSRHFEDRVRATNEIATELIKFMENRSEVEALWHPSSQCRERYDQLRKDDGGYGALFSFMLRGGEEATQQFYDALKVSKGPSLGTDFSLACPYTLLAHYDELEWAAERGAPKNLLRVWVGLEDPEDLIDRFRSALLEMAEKLQSPSGP